MNQQLETSLDQLFSQWQNGICPGVQALIRQSGQTLYEKSFGYANLEHQIPITSRTIFHVASISKQFTVLSVLLLWKDGRLDLDDDIRLYVGDLISFEEPMTIRQMMNNVSGLRDQWELLFMRGIKINDAITSEDVNSVLKGQRHLNFPPQSAYLYSNMGFHLLALIVERITGQTLPQFAKERIFQPLGMEHTCIRSGYQEIIPGLAYSYQDEGNGTYYYNPLNYSLYGPTSVNTCAEDLSRMLDEYLHPSVIDPDIIRLMKTPAVLSDGTEAEYCGGLMTHKLEGLTVYEHGGADAAYRGHVFCIPEKELEIIFLSNTTSRLMSRLADQAARLVLGLPEAPEPEFPVEHPQLLPARSGRFLTARPDDPQFVSVTEQGGRFYVEREYGLTELTPTADGGWQIGTLEEKLYFLEDRILYRFPSRFLTLKPALPCPEDFLEAGTYLEEETSMTVEFAPADGGLSVRHPRFGTAVLYSAADSPEDAAFSFGPDFTMYVKRGPEGLILDGYRVRGLLCRRV